MAKIQEDDREASFVFVGDLNAHHREWLSSIFTTNRHGLRALDFASESGFSGALANTECYAVLCQGAVERLNGVIQDKLAIWMQENNSKKWSVGFKFVQWQINISRHETTGHSPFKVTFGQEPKVGLGSSVLPRSALNEIPTEEDLETFVENKEGDEDAVTGVTAQEIQDAADAGQSKAAVRMTRRGNQLVRQLEVGECATLSVPDVDRGPTDPKNLIVVVMKGEDGLYTVGCREGVLGSKYTAADLSLID
ncbi:uncharacterized protein [Palaemon carinicauda]|uniref:uncharacterized protein n=1 Tax=Palaemon carinicauda TaxID=392227 RepID=UPI0035B671A5